MPDILGSTLGPYQILEQIGLGGMATVYKAYQPGMNRLVALKVLPEHYAHDPRFVKRFEREAQVVAKLEHRNIIPIYDYGSHNTTTFLAMRYLQAGTVKDILARGALPLPDVAKILSDVASALDYAHAHGIIHRDVKPSNILVDKQGNAYLTDFGIAKVLEGTADFTGSGVLGTPAYMAPEQTLGKPATAQSDIYSLGVMLYEMVVGKLPFEADTPMAIALMHVHEPLPLPRRIKEDIPEAVELIILKALAKDPKDRFPQAGELAKAFASAIGAETSMATGRLLELASGAAEGKGSEEVTYDVKEELKKRERTEQRKQILRFAPFVAGGLLLVGLIGVVGWLFNNLSTAQDVAKQTQAAIQLTSNFATEVALRPTETQGPTPTIDINAAATLQWIATQTSAPLATQTQAQLNTRNTAAQSAQQTIIALTPTNTPTVTRTPTITLTPLPTATPTVVKTLFDLNFCTPSTARAGTIQIKYGRGWPGKDRDTMIRLVGNTVAKITVNDQTTMPMTINPRNGTALNSDGRTIEIEIQGDFWGSTTYRQISLVAGKYTIRAEWIFTDGSNRRDECSLTVN